jgi:hypothetical protein
VLKGVMTLDEWKDIVQDISFDFARDNYFSELKDLDIMRERVAILRDMDDFAGKYVSHTWMRKNILRQTEEEIELEDEQINGEYSDPRFPPPPTPEEQQQQGETGQ